jgi:hypothetical protein
MAVAVPRVGVVCPRSVEVDVGVGILVLLLAYRGIDAGYVFFEERTDSLANEVGRHLDKSWLILQLWSAPLAVVFGGLMVVLCVCAVVVVVVLLGQRGGQGLHGRGCVAAATAVLMLITSSGSRSSGLAALCSRTVHIECERWTGPRCVFVEYLVDDVLGVGGVRKLTADWAAPGAGRGDTAQISNKRNEMKQVVEGY